MIILKAVCTVHWIKRKFLYHLKYIIRLEINMSFVYCALMLIYIVLASFLKKEKNIEKTFLIFLIYK